VAIVCKSQSEIEKMRRSGNIVRQILNELKNLVAPGVTTMDLERHAEKRMKELGAKPAFKVSGEITYLEEFGEVTAEDAQMVLYEIMPARNREASRASSAARHTGGRLLEWGPRAIGIEKAVEGCGCVGRIKES